MVLQITHPSSVGILSLVILVSLLRSELSFVFKYFFYSFTHVCAILFHVISTWITTLPFHDTCSLIKHGGSKYQQENYSYYFRVMLSHGSRGGITPTSRRRPSAKSERTTQPTHIEIIEALRLCLRIASSIISWTSSLVTCVMDFSYTNDGKHNKGKAKDAQTDGII